MSWELARVVKPTKLAFQKVSIFLEASNFLKNNLNGKQFSRTWRKIFQNSFFALQKVYTSKQQHSTPKFLFSVHFLMFSFDQQSKHVSVMFSGLLFLDLASGEFSSNFSKIAFPHRQSKRLSSIGSYWTLLELKVFGFAAVNKQLITESCSANMLQIICITQLLCWHFSSICRTRPVIARVSHTKSWNHSERDFWAAGK